jgi:hypothetical protein
MRSESERMRFLTRYGVDKTRLRNYDLVCDTTSATPEQVAETIVKHLHIPSPGTGPACYLDPKRIYPAEGSGEAGPVTVGYAAPYFFALQGHRQLSAAIADRQGLIAVQLVAEAGAAIAGLSCRDYLEANVTPGLVREWESAHGISLPHLDVVSAETR